jgi:YD repeat-containing protein
VTSLGGDDGNLQQTTDPRGITTKTGYHYFGRTVRTIEASSDLAPSTPGHSSSGAIRRGMK